MNTLFKLPVKRFIAAFIAAVMLLGVAPAQLIITAAAATKPDLPGVRLVGYDQVMNDAVEDGGTYATAYQNWAVYNLDPDRIDLDMTMFHGYGDNNTVPGSQVTNPSFSSGVWASGAFLFANFKNMKYTKGLTALNEAVPIGLKWKPSVSISGGVTGNNINRVPVFAIVDEAAANMLFNAKSPDVLAWANSLRVRQYDESRKLEGAMIPPSNFITNYDHPWNNYKGDAKLIIEGGYNSVYHDSHFAGRAPFPKPVLPAQHAIVSTAPYMKNALTVNISAPTVVPVAEDNFQNPIYNPAVVTVTVKNNAAYPVWAEVSLWEKTGKLQWLFDESVNFYEMLYIPGGATVSANAVFTSRSYDNAAFFDTTETEFEATVHNYTHQMGVGEPAKEVNYIHKASAKTTWMGSGADMPDIPRTRSYKIDDISPKKITPAMIMNYSGYNVNSLPKNDSKEDITVTLKGQGFADILLVVAAFPYVNADFTLDYQWVTYSADYTLGRWRNVYNQNNNIVRINFPYGYNSTLRTERRNWWHNQNPDTVQPNSILYQYRQNMLQTQMHTFNKTDDEIKFTYRQLTANVPADMNTRAGLNHPYSTPRGWLWNLVYQRNASGSSTNAKYLDAPVWLITSEDYYYVPWAEGADGSIPKNVGSVSNNPLPADYGKWLLTERPPDAYIGFGANSRVPGVVLPNKSVNDGIDYGAQDKNLILTNRYGYLEALTSFNKTLADRAPILITNGTIYKHYDEDTSFSYPGNKPYDYMLTGYMSLNQCIALRPYGGASGDHYGAVYLKRHADRWEIWSELYSVWAGGKRLMGDFRIELLDSVNYSKEIGSHFDNGSAERITLKPYSPSGETDVINYFAENGLFTGEIKEVYSYHGKAGAAVSLRDLKFLPLELDDKIYKSRMELQEFRFPYTTALGAQMKTADTVEFSVGGDFLIFELGAGIEYEADTLEESEEKFQMLSGQGSLFDLISAEFDVYLKNYNGFMLPDKVQFGVGTEALSFPIPPLPTIITFEGVKGGINDLGATLAHDGWSYVPPLNVNLQGNAEFDIKIFKISSGAGFVIGPNRVGIYMEDLAIGLDFLDEANFNHILRLPKELKILEDVSATLSWDFLTSNIKPNVHPVITLDAGGTLDLLGIMTAQGVVYAVVDTSKIPQSGGKTPYDPYSIIFNNALTLDAWARGRIKVPDIIPGIGGLDIASGIAGIKTGDKSRVWNIYGDGTLDFFNISGSFLISYDLISKQASYKRLASATLSPEVMIGLMADTMLDVAGGFAPTVTVPGLTEKEVTYIGDTSPQLTLKPFDVKYSWSSGLLSANENTEETTLDGEETLTEQTALTGAEEEPLQDAEDETIQGEEQTLGSFVESEPQAPAPLTDGGFMGISSLTTVTTQTPGTGWLVTAEPGEDTILLNVFASKQTTVNVTAQSGNSTQAKITAQPNAVYLESTGEYRYSYLLENLSNGDAWLVEDNIDIKSVEAAVYTEPEEIDDTSISASTSGTISFTANNLKADAEYTAKAYLFTKEVVNENGQTTTIDSAGTQVGSTTISGASGTHNGTITADTTLIPTGEYYIRVVLERTENDNGFEYLILNTSGSSNSTYSFANNSAPGGVTIGTAEYAGFGVTRIPVTVESGTTGVLVDICNEDGSRITEISSVNGIETEVDIFGVPMQFTPHDENNPTLINVEFKAGANLKAGESYGVTITPYKEVITDTITVDANTEWQNKNTFIGAAATDTFTMLEGTAADITVAPAAEWKLLTQAPQDGETIKYAAKADYEYDFDTAYTGDGARFITTAKDTTVTFSSSNVQSYTMYIHGDGFTTEDADGIPIPTVRTGTTLNSGESVELKLYPGTYSVMLETVSSSNEISRQTYDFEVIGGSPMFLVDTSSVLYEMTGNNLTFLSFTAELDENATVVQVGGNQTPAVSVNGEVTWGGNPSVMPTIKEVGASFDSNNNLIPGTGRQVYYFEITAIAEDIAGNQTEHVFTYVHDPDGPVFDEEDRTTDMTVLNTTATTVTLGFGDIFAHSPMVTTTADFGADGAGTGFGNGKEVQGSSLTFTNLTPDTDYLFKLTASGYEDIMVSARTLLADSAAGENYTVTYSSAGATDGFAPLDPNKYAKDETVKLLDVANEANRLTNNGKALIGFSTAPNAGGTRLLYGGADTFVMPGANVTLYPIWDGDIADNQLPPPNTDNSWYTPPPYIPEYGDPPAPKQTDEDGEAKTYSVRPPMHRPGAKVMATKTKDTLMLNGKLFEFPALKIGGFNYLKLRDLAFILKGTEKQFSIEYDKETNSIYITTGGAYTPVGDELEDNITDDPVEVIATMQKLYVDGKLINIGAYNADGYNYFRLRDIAILLDFNILYDPETKVITLDLENPYREEEPALPEPETTTAAILPGKRKPAFKLRVSA